MSQALLTIALKAARAAQTVFDKHFYNRSSVEVSKKSVNDFVTNVDKESEEAIISVIKQSFPNDIIVAEETAADFDPDSYTDLRKHVWIIDPLDGTRNFVMGNPHFSISIAVQEKGETVAAVVLSPITDELFTAVRGKGAYYNNKNIRLTFADRMDYVKGITGKILATGFPFKEPEKLERTLDLIPRMFEAGVCDYRRTASAALDLCYVAAGFFDGFYEEGLKPWDIAAGALIVKEARGLVMDYDLGEDYLVTGEIIAGSSDVCRDIARVIRKYDNEKREFTVSVRGDE